MNYMISLRRKFLFYIFVTLFLVATPLIILFANGYQIDMRHPFSFQMIKKSGMIIIETEPKNAFVYINNKKQENFIKNKFIKKSPVKTPAKIKNLLPGEYEIKLELNGYWPWTKKINIHPGQITLINDITLFKQNLPLKIMDARIQEAKTCPNRKNILLSEDSLLINLKKEEIIHLGIPGQKNSEYAWSPNGEKIIFNKILFNLNDINQQEDLSKTIGEEIKNIKWHDQNNDLIFYQYKNSLNSFNLNSKDNKEITKEKEYLDYTIKDNNLFIIFKNNNNINLEIISLDNKKILKEIELPFSEKYSFINSNNELLNLYDNNNEILYLINPFSIVNQLEATIKKAKHLKWIDNNNLLYANDFEIFIFNINSGNSKLLTRISDKITGINHNENNKYIIYSTEKNINILEINNNDTMLITELIKIDKIDSIYLSADNKILYFMAKIGNQEGLYKLNIQ